MYVVRTRQAWLMQHNWMWGYAFVVICCYLMQFVVTWCYLFMFATICCNLLLLTILICRYLLDLVNIFLMYLQMNVGSRWWLPKFHYSWCLKGSLRGEVHHELQDGVWGRGRSPPRGNAGVSGGAQCPPARLVRIVPKPGCWERGARQVSWKHYLLYHKWICC